MSRDSKSRSALPPPPNHERTTVTIPAVRSDADGIRDLLHAGPSPTTNEWPDQETVVATLDELDRRPTPPAFVVPDSPGHGTATLTLLRGIDAGRVFRLDRSHVVLGRGVDADLRIDDPAVSRSHARVVRHGDEGYTIEDLDSTNGTYVRGQPVQQARLRAGDRVQLGPHISFRFALLTDDENTLQKKLYESSVRDGLTGVFNRASLVVLVEEAVREARSTGTPLSILLMDLDHFKQINDQLGHAAGDTVLRAVAERLVHEVRINDYVARYGGEEFVIVARETSIVEGLNLAERLRASVAAVRIETACGVATTTASIGVASLTDCEACTGDEVLRVADTRMYEAKRRGRNRVWPGG